MTTGQEAGWRLVFVQNLRGKRTSGKLIPVMKAGGPEKDQHAGGDLNLHVHRL